MNEPTSEVTSPHQDGAHPVKAMKQTSKSPADADGAREAPLEAPATPAATKGADIQPVPSTAPADPEIAKRNA